MSDDARSASRRQGRAGPGDVQSFAPSHWQIWTFSTSVRKRDVVMIRAALGPSVFQPRFSPPSP